MSYRDVTCVIEKVLEIIPSDEVTIIDQLINYKSSLWNKAPEVLCTNECWGPLIEILNKNVTRINADWKVKLINIINNTEN
uniref:Uncharacterized protein n=1 Tax=viral metagenome TaxID=1070528 RepID=A0A6C0JGB8_9ZZZZ